MVHIVPDWASQALCAQVDVDPEVFYPHKGGSVRLALKVCAACPVENECLAWALRLERSSHCFGVFGGKSARQRSQMLNRRAAS